jgi:hypothetical protein
LDVLSGTGASDSAGWSVEFSMSGRGKLQVRAPDGWEGYEDLVMDLRVLRRKEEENEGQEGTLVKDLVRVKLGVRKVCIIFSSFPFLFFFCFYDSLFGNGN